MCGCREKLKAVAELSVAAGQSVVHQITKAARGEQTALQATRNIVSGGRKVGKIAWKGLVPNTREEKRECLANCDACQHRGAVLCNLCEECPILEKIKWRDAEWPDKRGEDGEYLCANRRRAEGIIPSKT